MNEPNEQGEGRREGPGAPDLPAGLLSAASREGLRPDTILLSIRSDLSPSGGFGEQWTLLTERELVVFAEEGTDGRYSLRHRMARAEIKEAKTEMGVGNGHLEVTVDDAPRLLLRFSNTVSEPFARLARYLDGVAQGRTLPLPVAEDESGQRRCKGCGLVLDYVGVCPKCLKKGKVIRRLWSFARPYWRWILGIFLLLLGATIVGLIPPLMTKVLVDHILVTDAAKELPQFLQRYYNNLFEPMLGEPTRLIWLGLLVAGLVGLRIMGIVLGIAGNRMSTTVGVRLTHDLRGQVFGRLQELSVRYYDRHQVGSLMTRCTQDTEELQSFIRQTPGLLLSILSIVGIFAVLAHQSWYLSLFVLVPAPFVMAATYFFWNNRIPKIDRYWYARWRINALLNSVLSGIRVVKAFAQEEREVKRFGERNRDLFAARRQMENDWNTFAPLVEFVFGIGGLLIWFFGGRRVLEGHMTLGTLMMFFGYLGMFYGPLSNLTGVSEWFTRFMTASQRVFELLDQRPEIKDAPDAAPMPQMRGELEFRDVSFGYTPYNLVLHNVSFKIEAGQMLGIVGHSGAGKTTLVNLLCRFYDVTEGAIRIDGVDVRKIRSADLRKHIGLVLQEPFLFRGTIAENIAYAKPSASRREIIRAAKAANAHDFICKLPEGYDTRLGERGSGLSGGERQRVSIARAILHDPRILILDEATSSVDTETERQIQEALAELVKGRTTIAIAHRLSTLQNADKLLVVDQGRVEEYGTHEELMAKKGRYYKFVQLQTELARLEKDGAHLAVVA